MAYRERDHTQDRRRGRQADICYSVSDETKVEELQKAVAIGSASSTGGLSRGTPYKTEDIIGYSVSDETKGRRGAVGSRDI